MTEEVNAAVEGIFKVDPNAEIIVNDAHGKSQNLIYEDMDERIKLIRGSAEYHDMMMGIDESYDAAMLIGFHARLQTKAAVLCHVWGLQDLYFNEKVAGEISINTYTAGSYDVPVVFVSGDKAISEEVEFLSREGCGPIEMVVVKEGMTQHTALCSHPHMTRRWIKEGAARALNKLDQIKPAKLATPIKLEMHFTNPGQADAASMMPGVERTSPLSTLFVADHFTEIKRAFYSQVRLVRPWLQF